MDARAENPRLAVRPGAGEEAFSAAGTGAAHWEADHSRGLGLSEPINSEAARRTFPALQWIATTYADILRKNGLVQIT